jgi:hypothetical protein
MRTVWPAAPRLRIADLPWRLVSATSEPLHALSPTPARLPGTNLVPLTHRAGMHGRMDAGKAVCQWRRTIDSGGSGGRAPTKEARRYLTMGRKSEQWGSPVSEAFCLSLSNGRFMVASDPPSIKHITTRQCCASLSLRAGSLQRVAGNRALFPPATLNAAEREGARGPRLQT